MTTKHKRVFYLKVHTIRISNGKKIILEFNVENICFVKLNYRQTHFTIPNIKELREYYPGAELYSNCVEKG